MKKIVIGLLLIVLVPIIGVAAFIALADFNNYKPQIEELARKYAGLEVKINGDLDVALSLKPTIELSQVTVALADGGQKIADIGTAEVQISLLPLLDKEVMIDSLTATETTVYYSDNDGVLINKLTADMDDFAAPIMVNADATVAGVNIKGKGQLSSLKELQDSGYNDLDADLQLSALGYDLHYVGAVKGMQDALTAIGTYELAHKKSAVNGNLEVSLVGKVPYIKLNASSDLINGNDFMAAQLEPSWLFADAVAAEQYIAGTQIPYEYLQMADADVTLDIKKITVNGMTISNLQAKANLVNGVFKADIKNAEIDGAKVNGAISLSGPKSRPYIKLNIQSNYVDLDKLLTSPAPAKGKKSSMNLDWLVGTAQASELLPNTPIPYEYFKMANADVNLNIAKLVINKDLAVTGVKADATLKNGVFKCNINNITAGTGAISGTLSLDAGKQTAAADIVGKDIVLQDFYKDFANSGNAELYIKSGGKTNWKIKVTTQGQNTDQYLSNLNGQVIAFADSSVVRIKSLDRLQGNIIVQILQNLNISLTKKEMNLACAVVRSDIKNGLMDFPKGIAFNADDFYVVGDGNINLNNDKINMDIQPFSGKLTDINISSLLGSLLKIKGTISSPKLTLNQTQTAKSVIGAIASAGMYNAGDLLLSADSSPCHTALKGTVYADYFKQGKSVRDSVSRGYNNTQDTVKAIGKGVSSQAKALGKGVKDTAKDFKNQIKGLFK